MTERAPLSQEQRESALKDILGPDLGAIVQAAHLLSADKSTTSRLLQVLEDERRVDNRHAILYALTWHANLATWGLMVSIFADSNETPKVRGQAAEALSYMFGYVGRDSKEFEAAVKALLDGLKDASPEVRYCAVNALGATGHLPLMPAITEMLADHTPVPGWVGTVSDEASRALEWLEMVHSRRG